MQIAGAEARDALELGRLLRLAVAEGFSLEFVRSPDKAHAQEWWRARIAQPLNLVLVAREGDRLVGTVTLALAAQENAAHRAEVKKLIVDSAARRQGIARALMTALEAEALRLGRSLVVLDTVPGSSAEAFYRAAGYVEVGVIPRFAAEPGTGDLVPTMLFYKELEAGLLRTGT